MISAGSSIKGATVDHSILGFNCEVDCGTKICDSVLLGDVKIGHGCRIRRAIIDKHVEIAPGVVIGEDPEQDRNLFTVSDGGIVVVPKGAKIGF